MYGISGSLQEVFENFLEEYFEVRVLVDSFDMIFGMIEHELRKIDSHADKLAVIDSISHIYEKRVSALNQRRRRDKELYLPLNIKYCAWEQYWRETIRAAKEYLYPEFSFNFDLIEKYCKTELEPYRAIEYLRWIYSRLVRGYKSDDAAEAIKIKLLNMIDDLELNFDSRRSRIADTGKQSKKAKRATSSDNQPDPGKFLDNKKAAEYLHITTVTLWRLRKASIIPFTKVGKKVLFSQADLDEYLKTDLLTERTLKTVKKTVKSIKN